MSQTTDVPEWVTLTEGETVVWDGHPSLRLIAPPVAVGIVLILAGAILFQVLDVEGVPSWLPLVLVPIGVVVIAWAYITHRSTRYVITSEEVYRKTGLLTRNVVQIRLDRVQNTACTQSLAERLFSYGDVTIYTAGSDTMDISLYDVPHPQQVNRLLTEQLDVVAESSSDPGRL